MVRSEGSHRGLRASGWRSSFYFPRLQCAHTLGAYELLTVVFCMNLDVYKPNWRAGGEEQGSKCLSELWESEWQRILHAIKILKRKNKVTLMLMGFWHTAPSTSRHPKDGALAYGTLWDAVVWGNGSSRKATLTFPLLKGVIKHFIELPYLHRQRDAKKIHNRPC